MKKTPESLIPSEQAAAHLGVSVKALERWRQNGRLLPRRVIRRTGEALYQLDVLEAFLASEATRAELHGASDRAFTFIDLFAGIGGMRVGFDRLNGRCVFSSEIDKYSCQTYNANFEEWPDGDITAIDVEDIPAHDVLIGGFPCQPFSLAGVSKYVSLGWDHGFLHKTKGTMFFEIAKILQFHRPHAFLLENVKTLKSHNRKQTWEIVFSTLSTLGYNVDYRVIDATSFVPQHRERIFIVGFRDKAIFDRFSWPIVSSKTKKLRCILEKDVASKYTLSDNLWRYLQDYAEKHRRSGNGFGYGLADLDGVSRTLSARYYKDGSEILIPQEGKNPRRLTPRECARLMGFDDDFVIPVSDSQAYRQFGNSVVVPLVKRLAESLIAALSADNLAGAGNVNVRLDQQVRK